MQSPTCPICCGRLGEHGGPTTLPCGHNGCLDCMKQVQSFRPECPLCRHSFTQDLKLSLNTDLRELISQYTSSEDWEVVEKSDAEIHLPTAPPQEIQEQDLDSLQPAIWMSDNSSKHCLSCGNPFTAILRTRHHCRLCGGLFCDACSANRRFLPTHIQRLRKPQRVCGHCAETLEPFQELLLRRNAGMQRMPLHDVFDWSAIRSWVNSPYSGSMEYDIYKATNIVRTVLKLTKNCPERCPKSTRGIMILSELKIATGIWSLRYGTGEDIFVLCFDEF